MYFSFSLFHHLFCQCCFSNKRIWVVVVNEQWLLKRNEKKWKANEVNVSILIKLQTTTTPRPNINNCREIISNKLQVKWEIQGDYVQIELIGRIREDQYMAFGLSGTNGRPQMVNTLNLISILYFPLCHLQLNHFN